MVTVFGLLHIRKALTEGDLSTGDRLEARQTRHLRELHRTVEAVVVSQGQGWITKLNGTHDQLLRVGRTVQEGKARMAVQLDVGDRHQVLGLRTYPPGASPSA